MRVLALLPLSAALLLAACNKPADPAQNDPQAAARAAEAARIAREAKMPAITGQLTLAGVNKLPPNSFNLELRLLDVTDPTAKPVVVAESIIPAPQALPYGYRLAYAADVVKPEHRYVVEGALSVSAGGARVYGTKVPSPVLSDGAGNTANLELYSGATSATQASASELAIKEFDELNGQLGGMTRVTGNRVDGDVSIGWDAFIDSENNLLRMGREQVQIVDGDKFSYRYAYKAGKPWFVVRDNGGTARVCWDTEGRIVINDDGHGGELDADTLDALHQRAEGLAESVAAKRK